MLERSLVEVIGIFRKENTVHQDESWKGVWQVLTLEVGSSMVLEEAFHIGTLRTSKVQEISTDNNFVIVETRNTKYLLRKIKLGGK
ncbi:MAG: hypothetical protein ACRDDF_04570 [Aeromonas sp.]